MKAAVYTKYGPPEVLRVEEVEKPVPGAEDLLIKVHAATVIKGDCEFRDFSFPLWFWLPLRLYAGVWRPKRVNILGQELSGVVEAAGKNVTGFHPGDQVFAATEISLGAHAEYCCLRADKAIALKPENMTFAQAAAVPTGGLNALHYMKLAHITPGERVLIVGACGNIGSFAVQIAKYFGAEVTGVDGPDQLGALRALGVDHVIDYTQEDFTANGLSYDVIFDTAGNSHYGKSLRALAPGGRYLLANPGFLQMWRSLWTGWVSDKTVLFRFAPYRVSDLEFLRNMIEAGHLTSLMDRDFPLAEIAEAHRYLESGRKVGNITLTIAEGEA